MLLIKNNRIDDLHEILNFSYTTYKRDPNTCSILIGCYKGTKVCVAKKEKNAGKKDSLVVTDDIFIKADEHFVGIRDAILREFDMDSCEFIFHTDADSVIGENAFRRMVNALNSNQKIAAVAGLVLVPFENFSTSGFWNLVRRVSRCSFNYTVVIFFSHGFLDSLLSSSSKDSSITMVK